MFGDSLTQRWDQEVWDKTLAPRGAFNLGVNGDRTEHLLWRLRNGHMPSRAPERHVVMIGTNNIGRGHPLVDVAEGVRAIIETLRAAHPATPVLVITPPPRADRPDLTRRVAELAAMLPACDDGDLVRVRDLGAALLDHGRLTRESAPDGLHFSASGYRRLSAALLPALDGHRPAPRQ
jgi:lysophospholipase L1-like esterase